MNVALEVTQSLALLVIAIALMIHLIGDALDRMSDRRGR